MSGRQVLRSYNQAQALPAGPVRQALIDAAKAASMDAYAEAIDLARRAWEADCRNQYGEALCLILDAHREAVEALTVCWPELWPRSDGTAA